MMWVYNSDNLWIGYRYWGFILASSRSTLRTLQAIGNVSRRMMVPVFHFLNRPAQPVMQIPDPVGEVGQ
jgi:hypothetical protein